YSHAQAAQVGMPGLRGWAYARYWRRSQMPGKKWSFFENGMPGLHLTINPRKPLPAEAHVVQQFANQGITLNDRERESILRGRGEGVGTVKTILDNLIPGFAPDKRLKFANQ